MVVSASGASTNTVTLVSSLVSLTVASIAVGVCGKVCSGKASPSAFLPALELLIALAPTYTSVGAAIAATTPAASANNVCGVAATSAPSCRVPVQTAGSDDVEDRLGHQIVQRPTISNPGPEVGARHLEAGHLDAQPVEASR